MQYVVSDEEKRDRNNSSGEGKQKPHHLHGFLMESHKTITIGKNRCHIMFCSCKHKQRQLLEIYADDIQTKKKLFLFVHLISANIND